MLCSVDDLTEYYVIGIDGEIGSIRGLYFEDASWQIQFLILDTGTWLPGRKVIISPKSVKRLDHDKKEAHLLLTKEKIETSPEIDEDEPLSADFRKRIDAHYGWSGGVSMGTALQNTRDVVGSYIEARDGDIGHVEDFIFDDEHWTIRYMVVDTKNWWPGKKVLISPSWVQSLRWMDKEVRIDLTREKIKSSPEYVPGRTPARDYEERLYGHYGRSGYWTEQAFTR